MIRHTSLVSSYSLSTKNTGRENNYQGTQGLNTTSSHSGFSLTDRIILSLWFNIHLSALNKHEVFSLFITAAESIISTDNYYSWTAIYSQ